MCVSVFNNIISINFSAHAEFIFWLLWNYKHNQKYKSLNFWYNYSKTSDTHTLFLQHGKYVQTERLVYISP
jgi:hypothetical protein